MLIGTHLQYHTYHPKRQLDTPGTNCPFSRLLLQLPKTEPHFPFFPFLFLFFLPANLSLYSYSTVPPIISLYSPFFLSILNFSCSLVPFFCSYFVYFVSFPFLPHHHPTSIFPDLYLPYSPPIFFPILGFFLPVLSRLVQVLGYSLPS